jgi:hypothetical protein
MVSASFVPLVTLLLARLCGATAFGAADIALVVTIALLGVHGHAAGRAAGVRGARLAIVTATAVLLGAFMVLLKALLQHHHQ